MARVNCYLPDELRNAALEVDDLNFSEILRLGVVARLKVERERWRKPVDVGASVTE